ncbi:MAG: ribonuclease P protein component [Candidatus Nealsonbacteria bacterium]|nr:ribonuclease P protein component [Candidatus Nealsonbacteria bacterium]
MLSKENRLKNTKEIELVFKKGKGFKAGFLFLKLVRNDLKTSRFAFVVSKKAVPKATDRNRIKRRLRDIVRRNAARIKAGFDLVIIVQKGIERVKFQKIKEDAEEIFKKANLWDF